MSDDNPSLEAVERGTILPALLARFVEAYECSPNRAEYVLRFRHLLGRTSVSPKTPNKSAVMAFELSNEASSDQAFQRVLHVPDKYLNSYEALLSDWYRGNLWDLQDELNEDEITSWDADYELSESERARRGHPLDSPHFVSMLERNAEAFDGHPNLRNEVARELGVDATTPAFDLALRQFQSGERDSEERYLRRIENSNALLLWAKELVGRLPEVVERDQSFKAHAIASMNGYVPQSIMLLFEQAHICHIFDLEIACVVLSGGLIEEAFEVRFPKLRDKWHDQQHRDKKAVPWRQRVAEVVERLPSFSDQANAVLEVLGYRNDAIHEPAKYLRERRTSSGRVLEMSRKILQCLFESCSAQEGTGS